MASIECFSMHFLVFLLDLQFNLMQHQSQHKNVFDDITIMLTLIKLHWILSPSTT